MLRSVRIFLTVAMVCALPMNSFSGDLDPPGGPSDPVSAMYSLEDIYYRLAAGHAGEKRTDVFSEPVSEPQSGSGYTLDDIMSAAPSADNTSGAGQNDVMAGKRYWGLRTDSSEWGMLTGTMTSRTLSAGSNKLEAGYYEATDLDAIDLDLKADNIKKGTSIFGIGGTVLEAAGDAASEHVLTGRTFSSANAAGLSGTMSDIGAVNITPGNGDQAIAQGYHDGLGVVRGDPDLLPGNIKSNVSIFGVPGDSNVVDTSSGDATSADILAGKKVWVDGNEVIGNMQTRNLSNMGVDVESGYYAATSLDAVEPDLLSQNIRRGISIFGLTGTFNGVTCAGTMSTEGRWCNNGDGTVTDMTTGLIWLQDAACADITTMYWEPALLWVTTNLKDSKCGLTDGSTYGDWRLPTFEELKNIKKLNGVETISTTSSQFFNIIRVGVSDYIYWTNTSTNDTDFAYTASIDGTDLPGDKDFNQYFIWPVRRQVIPDTLTTYP